MTGVGQTMSEPIFAAPAVAGHSLSVDDAFGGLGPSKDLPLPTSVRELLKLLSAHSHMMHMCTRRTCSLVRKFAVYQKNAHMYAPY
jgi:hypothetical protein